jgi:hypothetical protein
MTAPYSKGTKLGDSNNKVDANLFDQELRAKIWPTYRAQNKTLQQFDADMTRVVANLKPTFGGGICFSLTLHWLAGILKGNAGRDLLIDEPQARADYKKHQSRYQTNAVAGVLQNVEPTQAVRDAAIGIADDIGVILGGIAATGTFKNSSDGPGEFVRTLTEKVLSVHRAYVFAFQMPRIGSHATGLYIAPTRVVFFDPNYGVYEYTNSMECASDLKMVFYGWEAPYRGRSRGRGRPCA